jgi:phospholipase C
LLFLNTGAAGAVFQVRSANAADLVRNYTVESGKSLTGTWSEASAYNLSVYGPNGFVRYFNGSFGSRAAALDVQSGYSTRGSGSINLAIRNVAAHLSEVIVLDAYTGSSISEHLSPGQSFEKEFALDAFYGWYDLIVTVAEDPTFSYRLAGHVENGEDSFSDPAMGGLVTLHD